MTQPTFPWPPGNPWPGWLLLPVSSSSFQTAAMTTPATFAWDFGGPQRERGEGSLMHLKGNIYAIGADFAALFEVQKPVAVTPVTPVGPVYLDFWGDDPTGTLITPAGTYQAILTSLRDNQWLPGDVHKCDADFLIVS